MKRKYLVFFILLFIVGIGFLLGYFIISKRIDDEYKQQLDKKLEKSEMVLYYEITQNRPLKVKLMPNDREIKVISHLNVRRIEPHDNLKEYLYGLRVEIVDDNGKNLWSNIYWEKTRKTKITEDETSIEWEKAFYLERKDIMPTDSRLTTVFLSGILQDIKQYSPKYLKISLVSEHHQSAVIRCYRRVKRPAEDRELAWKRLSLKTRLKLIEYNIYSIDMLTEEEKTKLTKYKWERIFAEGKKGKDYILKSVYLSQIKFPTFTEIVEENETRGFLIHRQRAACVNVKGNGQLKIETVKVGKNKKQFPIKIRRLDDTGKISWKETFPSYSKEGVGEIILDVPAGLHTYTIEAYEACFVRFYVDSFPDMVVGEDFPIAYTSEDWYHIEPEIHTVTYYRSLGTDDLPIIEADVSYNKLYSGYIRIASRLRIETDNVANIHQYVVHYEMLDSERKSITKNSYTVQTTASVYDFYDNKEHNRKIVEEYIPSESNYFYLPLTSKTKTVRLWSEQVVDFALYVHYSGNIQQVRITDRYITEREKDIVLSSCSDDYDKEWYYFRPNNFEELEGSGRAIVIRWQCQMIKERERKRKFGSKVEEIAEVITPDIYEREVKLLEKVEPDEDRIYGRNLTFFEVNPNEDIQVRFFDYDNPHNQLPLPVDVVYYKSNYSQSSATLFIDSEKYDEYVLLNKAGVIVPEEITQGIHTVKFSTPSVLRMFINRIPKHTEQNVMPVLWKRRTSYSLRRGHPIVLTVRKKSRQAKTVNIIAYQDSSRDCVIKAKIYSSNPPIPSQSRTARERIYSIQTWEKLRCFDISTGIWYPSKQRFTLTLKNDLKAGEYRVQFNILNRGSALLRFFVMEDVAFPVNRNHFASLNLIGPGILKITPSSEKNYRLISRRLDYKGGVAFGERMISKTGLEFTVPYGLHTYSFSTPEKENLGLYFYVNRVPEMLVGKYRIFHSEPYENRYFRVEPDSYITRYYHSSNKGRIVPLTVELHEYMKQNSSTNANRRPVIRVASRIRLDESENQRLPQNYTVYYKVFSSKGDVISKGRKEIVAIESAVYDRYLSPNYYGILSEANYFHIHIPDEQVRLQIWSNNEHVALALYSQMHGYVRDVYIPEDKLLSNRQEPGSLSVSLLDSSHNREWQPLTPSNHRELFFADCMTKIESQKLMIKVLQKSRENDKFTMMLDNYTFADF